LADYPISAARSDFEFYQSGAIRKPIPAMKHSTPFLEANIPGLWLYYCTAGGNNIGTTDRLLAMPLYRTRILGVQLYRYNIEGFLNWGYNFYKNQYSYDCVNPFSDTAAEFFGPSGDAFLVYPGGDDQAWESIRLNALREAVDDMRALELCESVCGREFTEELIGKLDFFEYPTDSEYLLSLRDKIALAVEEKLAK
jgi:hypothetical protein